MRRKITIIVEDDKRPETNAGWPDEQPATNKGWPNDGWLPATNTDSAYDPCRNCPNRGKGACMCALPVMFGPNRITYGYSVTAV